MGLRCVLYLLAGSFVVFIHDVFNTGPGIMFIAFAFWWRALVWYARLRREESEAGER
jgi:hypothetical protein